MADRTSPTGYWAVYLLSDEFVAAVNRRGNAKCGGLEVLPVVTWTPEGEAAVFNGNGILTPVSRLHAGVSEMVITHQHPAEEK